MALCAGLLLVTPSVGVDAKPKPPPKKDKVSSAEPAPLKKAPRLKPNGIQWGLSPKQLADIYDRAIEQDYLKRYKEVEPGIQEERLKEEIETKKRVFRQSYLELDHPPGSLDGSPFEGEFGYYNDEGFMKIDRKGRMRYFFFWKKKLYKIIDVHKLGKDAKYGENFAQAVAKVEKALGEGRKLAANDERREQVDWADDKTHFTVVNWAKGKASFLWEEKRTEEPIVKARAEAKEKKKEGMDPKVKDVLRDKKKDDEPEKGGKKKK